MIRIVLCRHSIRENISEQDCGISDEGVELIDTRMEEIKKFIKNPSVIYTSPYKRTIETSLCISSHFSSEPTIIINKYLRETVFNERQIKYIGKSLTTYVRKYLKTEYDTWDDIYFRSKKFIEDMQFQATLLLKDNAEYDSELSRFEYIGVTHGGIMNGIMKCIDVDYVFDDQNDNPVTYIPKYFDYVVLDITKDSINIVYRNF